MTTSMGERGIELKLSRQQRELLGLGWRRGVSRAAAHAVLAAEPPHPLDYRADDLLGQVGAPGVKLLVPGDELGPVPGQAGQEMLAGPRPQVEEVGPDVVS